MNTGENAKEVEILLVEDNPGDVRLTIEALKFYIFLGHINFSSSSKVYSSIDQFKKSIFLRKLTFS